MTVDHRFTLSPLRPAYLTLFVVTEGEVFKTWRRRFCRLKNQMLFYHKGADVCCVLFFDGSALFTVRDDIFFSVLRDVYLQDPHPKGVIHLENCNIRDADAKTKRKLTLEVYHPQRRVFYLQAETVRSTVSSGCINHLLSPLVFYSRCGCAGSG